MSDKLQDQSDFTSAYTWLTTTIARVHIALGEETYLRVLVDNDSKVSMISTKAMTLPRPPMMKIGLQIPGVNGDVSMTTKVGELQIHARDDSAFSCRLVAAVDKGLQQRHPALATSVAEWPIPTDITPADPDFNKTRVIDMILAADAVHKLMDCKRLELGQEKSNRDYTRLRWVVAGTIFTPSSSTLTHTLRFSFQPTPPNHQYQWSWSG